MRSVRAATYASTVAASEPYASAAQTLEKPSCSACTARATFAPWSAPLQ